MSKVLIFDCFGVVLTDALGALLGPLRETDARKADEVVDSLAAVMHGIITSEESQRRIAPLLGLSLTEYRAQLDAGEVKNQPLLEYIKMLRKTYRTAMLSNVSKEGLWRRFSREELAAYFEVVVVSGEIGYAKPEPQAYEIVADRLGVRLEDCIMIDDREEYCEGARAVGMQTILYTTFEDFKKQLAVLL